MQVVVVEPLMSALMERAEQVVVVVEQEFQEQPISEQVAAETAMTQQVEMAVLAL
jgi:hypothetical protein